MTELKLRILELSADDGAAPAPRLELSGYWLADAGFPVGARVEVEVVEPGRLVVTRVDEEGTALQGLLPLLWIPAERLAALEAAGVGRG